MIALTHKHTHPFNGPFSGTTWVSRYQKGKTNLDVTKARDSEWQWHQLGHMQVCTSLQRDNHASNHSFFTGRMPFLLPNQRNDCTELSSKYRLRVDGSRRGHLLLSSLLIGMLLLLLVHCHWWILVDTAAGSAMHQRHRGRHCIRHHLWHVACRQRS